MKYKDWLEEVTAILNRNAIRPLAVKDFPDVNFQALHRTGHRPASAA